MNQFLSGTLDTFDALLDQIWLLGGKQILNAPANVLGDDKPFLEYVLVRRKHDRSQYLRIESIRSLIMDIWAAGGKAMDIEDTVLERMTSGRVAKLTLEIFHRNLNKGLDTGDEQISIKPSNKRYREGPYDSNADVGLGSMPLVKRRRCRSDGSDADDEESNTPEGPDDSDADDEESNTPQGSYDRDADGQQSNTPEGPEEAHGTGRKLAVYSVVRDMEQQVHAPPLLPGEAATVQALLHLKDPGDIDTHGSYSASALTGVNDTYEEGVVYS